MPTGILEIAMTMTTTTLAQTGFALVTSPVTRGTDGKVTLTGSSSLLNGKVLKGRAIEQGRLAWFPQDKLVWKAARYRAIKRAIQSYGMKWGDSTLVPLDKLDSLMAEVKAEITKTFAELDGMEPFYEGWIDDYAASESPAVAELINQVRVPWTTFRASFKLLMPSPSIFTPIGDTGGVQMEIMEAALEDIVDVASELRCRLLGKAVIDPRSIPPIKRLAEKCRSYAIVNAGFAALADEFTSFEAQLVAPIKDAKAAMLNGYLVMLSTPKAISEFIANHTAQAAKAGLDNLFGPETLVQDEPELPLAVEPPLDEQPLVPSTLDSPVIEVPTPVIMQSALDGVNGDEETLVFTDPFAHTIPANVPSYENDWTAFGI